jgi:hypothetical protein
MENFKSTLVFCGFPKIDCRVSVFTRNNGIEGADYTMKRLDRVVANHAWHNLYPNVESFVEVSLFSDHLPIFINQSGSSNIRRRGRGFRFEVEWGENRECKNVIKKIWRVKETEQGTWKSVEKQLKESKGGLIHGRRYTAEKQGEGFGSCPDNCCRSKTKNEDVNVSLIHKIQSYLSPSCKTSEEDLHWCQRAKVGWDI